MSKKSKDKRGEDVIFAVQRVIEKDGGQEALMIVISCLLMIAYETLPPDDRGKMVDAIPEICRKSMRDYDRIVESNPGMVQ
jgi:hypothetical protein